MKTNSPSFFFGEREPLGFLEGMHIICMFFSNVFGGINKNWEANIAHRVTSRFFCEIRKFQVQIMP